MMCCSYRPVIDELRVLWEQKLGETGILNSPDEE